MPIFQPNQPVETTEPFVRVETSNLQPGTYRFQLVVIDATGVASAPDEVTITIRRRLGDIVIPPGGRIVNP
jgi:hypothetical protein